MAQTPTGFTAEEAKQFIKKGLQELLLKGRVSIVGTHHITINVTGDLQSRVKPICLEQRIGLIQLLEVLATGLKFTVTFPDGAERVIPCENTENTVQVPIGGGHDTIEGKRPAEWSQAQMRQFARTAQQLLSGVLPLEGGK